MSNACKFPSGSVPDWEKATRYPLTIENLSNETVTITPGAVTMDGNRNDQDAGRFYSADGCPMGDLISEVTIPEGESRTFYYGVNNTSNSGNFTGSINMEFSVKGDSSGRWEIHSTGNISVPGTPPCDGCGKNAGTTTDQKAAESAESAPAEDATAESDESTVAEEPAASDAGGEEPAASDGGR